MYKQGNAGSFCVYRVERGYMNQDVLNLRDRYKSVKEYPRAEEVAELLIDTYSMIEELDVFFILKKTWFYNDYGGITDVVEVAYRKMDIEGFYDIVVLPESVLRNHKDKTLTWMLSKTKQFEGLSVPTIDECMKFLQDTISRIPLYN